MLSGTLSSALSAANSAIVERSKAAKNLFGAGIRRVLKCHPSASSKRDAMQQNDGGTPFQDLLPVLALPPQTAYALSQSLCGSRVVSLLFVPAPLPIPTISIYSSTSRAQRIPTICCRACCAFMVEAFGR